MTARRHVLTRLRSQIRSASALADRVEADVEMGRAPMSDLRTSRAVAELTITDMGAALAELELARATVLVDGPAADIEALAALGHAPSHVQPVETAASAPGVTAPTFMEAEQRVLRSEVVPALTLQPRPRLAWTASATVGRSGTPDEVLEGYAIAGAVGYRFGWATAVGLHLGAGRFTGEQTSSSLVPVNVLAMWHFDGTRMWGDALVGMHLERRSGDWRRAPLYGFQAGVDLVGGLGLALRWETTFRSDLDYAALSIGLAYRR